MAFEKGHKKVGGRKAGTPNKSTLEFRNVLAKEIQEEHSNFWQRIRGLDDFQYAQIYLKLMNFYLPKPNQLKIDYTTMSDDDKQEFIRQVAEQMNELKN